MKLISTLITAYAALLAVCGLVLVFAPSEVAASIGAGGGGEPALVQVLGAALLGFAAANWAARTSVLGGIYGRAVVGGNQVFAFVGVLSLLGGAPEAPGVGYWVAVALLAAGTVLFSWLLYRGPRIASAEA